MREVIYEANATIDQLREVATTIARAQLTDLMAGNFMSGITLGKRMDIHDEVLAALDKLGVSAEQRSRAEAEWRRGIAVTYHRIIGAEMVETAKTLNLAHPQIAKAFEETLDFDQWSVQEPARMEQFCKEHGVDSPEVWAWIADFSHFLSANEVRRREQFVLG